MSPAFRYEGYDSRPYALSIADIIRQKGQIAADAAARTGQIQADAQRQSGQIWGNTIQSAGQQVAGAVQAANDPRRKLEDIQLKDAQQRQAGQQQLDTLAKPYTPSGPQPEGAGPAPQQHPYLDDNGLWKIPELSQALASSGMAHMAPELLKGAEQINESITTAKQKQQAFAQAQTVMAGDMADSTLKLVKAGMPLEQALDQSAAAGLASKAIDAQQYAQVKARLLGAPPEQQQALLGGLMDAAAKVAPTKTLSKDAQEVDRYNRVIAQNAGDPNEGGYTINGQRFTKDGKPIGALIPQQAGPKALQRASVILDGKPAEVQIDPDPTAKHKVFDLNGAPITDAATRIKPVPTATQIRIDNPKVDASVADVKETVQGMKEGTIPPQLPGRASKEYVAIMAESHRQGYDLAGAATDWAATQKHIATLNGNQQTRLMQSINQLPELLDSVDTLAGKWKGGQFPILNKANLALAKGGAYGRDVATVANQLSAQIADVTSDLGAVYMGGNTPTDHSLDLAKQALSADWDEKVLKDMVKLARNNVQIRKNSINNTGVQGVSDSNPYAPKTVTPQPTGRFNPATGKVEPIR